MNRKYHLVAINEKTNRSERMTASPVTHAEGRILMSKISPHPARRIQLQEVSA